MKKNALALPERALVGSYEIRVLLGQGGGGSCYLAYDCQLEREVVLKEHFPSSLCMRMPDTAEVLPIDEVAYKHSLSCFCREARILAGLNHPAVVKVYDIFRACGTAYMVMEYVAGDSLEQWLPEHVHDTAAVEDSLVRLLEALEYIHAHDVLHRDVKPSNIIMRDGQFPVLIDFGAALLGTPDHTCTLVGSPGFAPPEQFQPCGEIGPWSDLYALAHTYLAHIPADKMHLYRRQFEQSLLRASQPMKEERYASAAAWKAHLQQNGGRQFSAVR